PWRRRRRPRSLARPTAHVEFITATVEYGCVQAGAKVTRVVWGSNGEFTARCQLHRLGLALFQIQLAAAKHRQFRHLVEIALRGDVDIRQAAFIELFPPVLYRHAVRKRLVQHDNAFALLLVGNSGDGTDAFAAAVDDGMQLVLDLLE